MCLTGCTQIAKKNDLNEFYCFIPDYGLKTKLSDNNEFFALGESKAEIIGDYMVSIKSAYYDEDNALLHFSMTLTAEGNAKESFFEKYNDVKNRPEIVLYCENKELKYEYGTSGMDTNHGNTYSFGGWFSCPDDVKNKEFRITGDFGECKFSLQKLSGYESLKEIGKVIDEGNGTYTLLIEGNHNSKQGIFITAYSDKSVFSDINGLSDGELYISNTNKDNLAFTVEKLNANVLFAFTDEVPADDLLKNNIKYTYVRSLNFGNENIGKATLKISDIENGIHFIDIALFDDKCLTLYDIEINTDNSKQTFKCKAKTSDNLKLLLPVDTLYITDENQKEKKLISMDNGEFSYAMSGQEIIVRAELNNIFDICSDVA